MNAAQAIALAILIAALIAVILVVLVMHFERHEAPAATERPCLICGLQGELPVLDGSGTIEAYICARCDQRQHRRRTGLRGRVNARLRKAVKI